MQKQIKLFSVIKSLDFPGNEDYYVVGTVVEFIEDMIKVKGFTKTMGQRTVDTDDYFMIPAPGVHFLDEKFPGRVTVIA